MLTDPVVEPFGQGLVPLGKPSAPKGSQHVIIRRLRPGKQQVSAYSVVEEMRVLCHDADVVAYVLLAECAEIGPSETDHAALRIGESQCQMSDRALPRTAR